MSIGSMAGLGGGLSLDSSPSCDCYQFNPLLYPPDPCCNSGNGCGNDGGGGGGGIGVLPPGSPSIPPGTGGNGGGNCCSDNGGGPFVAPGSGPGGGSCGSCGNGGPTITGVGGGNGNNQIACLDSTYGGGRGSLPTPLGNIRNGARLIPLGLPVNPCVLPVGTAPSAVPGASAPFSQALSTVVSSTFGPNVEWLLITCTESGVTLTSTCSTVTFRHNDNSLKHYTTPGGTGLLCESHPLPHLYSSGSGQGTPGLAAVTIVVTQTG